MSGDPLFLPRGGQGQAHGPCWVAPRFGPCRAVRPRVAARVPEDPQAAAPPLPRIPDRAHRFDVRRGMSGEADHRRERRAPEGGLHPRGRRESRRARLPPGPTRLDHVPFAGPGRTHRRVRSRFRPRFRARTVPPPLPGLPSGPCGGDRGVWAAQAPPRGDHQGPRRLLAREGVLHRANSRECSSMGQDDGLEGHAPAGFWARGTRRHSDRAPSGDSPDAVGSTPQSSTGHVGKLGAERLPGSGSEPVRELRAILMAVTP